MLFLTAKKKDHIARCPAGRGGNTYLGNAHFEVFFVDVFPKSNLFQLTPMRQLTSTTPPASTASSINLATRGKYRPMLDWGLSGSFKPRNSMSKACLVHLTPSLLVSILDINLRVIGILKMVVFAKAGTEESSVRT